ncbi:glycoside hydrolase family 16 protein [Lepidopterella palustris CBS 459.81]|uniref:chitinase n=1 Tax=Lepidopterella palustris CBS 459.81 TaxID=1314670 RepID=A0A8E2EJ16_9PEZI|nr:glycoside hydrolase family 16 protein [Lepidopterella palustris CBS 459.81]
MHTSSLTLLAILTSFLILTSAQTTTTCNPTTNTTCPHDSGISSTTFASNFSTSSTFFSNSSWSATAGSITYTSSGAEFVVKEKGDAPTIETDFYFFFGEVEVVMQAASGTGIVSSVVMESDDLDEIDWELLGGNTTSVETNYFGKGNTTTYDRAIYYPVTTPQSTYHTYTVNWTSSSTVWLIDSVPVRTLHYADAVSGTNYPQTPMRLKLGIWAGGDSDNSEGTIAWAGGKTDYSNGPFTVIVKSVRITNSEPGKSYWYNGTTGAWESIVVVGGNGREGVNSSVTANSTVSGTAAAAAAAAATKTSDAGSGAGEVMVGVESLIIMNFQTLPYHNRINMTFPTDLKTSDGFKFRLTTSQTSTGLFRVRDPDSPFQNPTKYIAEPPPVRKAKVRFAPSPKYNPSPTHLQQHPMHPQTDPPPASLEPHDTDSFISIGSTQFTASTDSGSSERDDDGQERHHDLNGIKKAVSVQKICLDLLWLFWLVCILCCIGFIVYFAWRPSPQPPFDPPISARGFEDKRNDAAGFKELEERFEELVEKVA